MFWKLCKPQIALLSLLLLAGCDKAAITPVAQDLTPPVAKLDLYGIPGDGSYTPPAYEDVNSMCCDVTRRVGLNHKIDLIASGEDKDGGVQSIAIRATVFLTCKKGSVLTGEFYHELKEITVAESTDTLPPSESVRTFRVAQGSIQLADFENSCREGFHVEAYQVVVFAIAENFHGGTDTTKKVTLTSP